MNSFCFFETCLLNERRRIRFVRTLKTSLISALPRAFGPERGGAERNDLSVFWFCSRRHFHRRRWHSSFSLVRSKWYSWILLRLFNQASPAAQNKGFHTGDRPIIISLPLTYLLHCPLFVYLHPNTNPNQYCLIVRLPFVSINRSCVHWVVWKMSWNVLSGFCVYWQTCLLSSNHSQSYCQVALKDWRDWLSSGAWCFPNLEP